MQLKEFTTIDAGGSCPECGSFCGTNEGGSTAGDEGTFFFCPYCSKPSLLIYQGARFIVNPRDPAYTVRTVYEIIGDPHLYENCLIPCIEVKKINASPLNKVNKNYCTYFTLKQIIEYMNENYREDL